MQQQITIEQKQSRRLILPKFKSQTQQKTISFMQNKQQLHQVEKQENSKVSLPTDFFVSLMSLEPKQQNLLDPSLELLKTLIDSYQLVIDQLESEKQDGLMLYFQNKLTQLLQQPSVKKTISTSNEKELKAILEKAEQSLKQTCLEENELLVLQQQFRREKAPSLMNYISAQERLEKEQEKVNQIIQEFEEATVQFDEMYKKDLDNQDAKLQDRLKKRGTIFFQIAGTYKHSSQHS